MCVCVCVCVGGGGGGGGGGIEKPHREHWVIIPYCYNRISIISAYKGGRLNISATNLKSEEVIHLYFVLF